ncbi:unnamed protein product [Aphanomyces euteiches]
MMDKLENIDNYLEIDPEKPAHEQFDVFVELVIQLQRGLEYYELQIVLGNIKQNDDFEYLVKSCQDQVCNAIDALNRARGISDDFQRDMIEPWLLSSDDVDYNPESTTLGEGGYGAVFKGKYYNRDVAVKRFHSTSQTDSADLEDQISKEIKAWKEISHEPYILNLIGVCSKIPRPILVSELCQTNIRRYVRDRRETLIPMVYQFACDLVTIHKANIIHRDLKGDNVLVTNQKTVAIADFGLSRSVTSLEQTNIKPAGTLNWMSPEQYFLARSVTTKSDVWSFGMTLWEILCNDTPLRRCSDHEVITSIFQTEEDRPAKPEDYLLPELEPLWTLITRCWRLSPEDRPSALEIKEFLEEHYNSQINL